ncbi:GntR family transcriptional regulator [Nocardia sp. NPDC005825]|uniref:FadR/GntR family transcriptional regulator n=1 Tax=unclassified Nocardia TaxID=2637762 RepID=UPI0033E10AC4
MEFEPVQRSAVSDIVFAQLLTQILAADVAAGETIPSERELSAAFQVNRHAVREALKRLQALGVVEINQGGKTRVLDWRAHANLDALSALALAGAIPPVHVLSDVMVLRRTVAADAARLCAVNASEEQVAAVAAAARAYPETPDPRVLAADAAFWTAVIDGSGNIAYRLALNTILSAIGALGARVLAAQNFSAELLDRDGHLALADSIVARDAETAYQLADTLLSRVVTAVADAASR